MTTAVRYSLAVNAEDRAALVAATQAVNDAPPRQPGRKGEVRDARRARADLIREITRRYRGELAREIAEATGLHRTRIYQIVDGVDE